MLDTGGPPQAGQAPWPTGTSVWASSCAARRAKCTCSAAATNTCSANASAGIAFVKHGADHRRLTGGIGRLDAIKRKARVVRHGDVGRPVASSRSHNGVERAICA